MPRGLPRWFFTAAFFMAAFFMAAFFMAAFFMAGPLTLLLIVPVRPELAPE